MNLLNKKFVQKAHLSIFCRLHYLDYKKFCLLSHLVDEGYDNHQLHEVLQSNEQFFQQQFDFSNDDSNRNQKEFKNFNQPKFNQLISQMEFKKGEIETFATFLEKKKKTWSQCKKLWDQILETQTHITFPGDENYPCAFLDLTQPPVFLNYLGSPIWCQFEKGLSVVGSRKASEVSLEWMEKYLADFLEEFPTPVISGGAWGVDQKAHGVALKSGVPTAVFLPSGFDEMYPEKLHNWIEPILEGGGVFISEYFPSATVRRLHFHERNRMIAALGKILLVIEASMRSGTMITARYATELSRTVGVLPGHPLWSGFSGNLALLSSGTPMVKDDLDIKILWEM